MCKISLELFPPADDAGLNRVIAELDLMKRVRPDFLSVTYGACGADRTKSFEAAARLRAAGWDRIVGHLTATGSDEAQLFAALESYTAAGATDILALRGDERPGAERTCFSSSIDLVAALRPRVSGRIIVGAYPEGHPRSSSMEQNLDFLSAKFDAGADLAISQFFYDADAWFRFEEGMARRGHAGKVIPGVLPIRSIDGLRRFAKGCGAALPDSLEAAFDKAAPDNHARIAHDLVLELITRLVSGGVEALHLYCLNRSDLTLPLLHDAGLIEVARKAA